MAAGNFLSDALARPYDEDVSPKQRKRRARPSTEPLPRDDGRGAFPQGEADADGGQGGTDAALRAFGLTATMREAADGTPLCVIRGDTHPHRHLFRELGGAWDRIGQFWAFRGADPRGALAARLGEGGSPSGLADVAGPAERPSYWGHRQRLRERFLAGDDEALPDYELLELLLFFAIPRIDTKPLAKKLLKELGSLGRVATASPERLADFEEINHHAIVLFRALVVFAGRFAREELGEAPILDNWNKLITYLRATMAHLMVEQFRLLFLDRRNVLIADEVQHEGSIDHTPVYPREVVKRALTLNASALIMVHNHPSNHPQPSPADIDMTRHIKHALDSVGIVLHDHVIVSRKGQTSFKQMRLL